MKLKYMNFSSVLLSSVLKTSLIGDIFSYFIYFRIMYKYSKMTSYLQRKKYKNHGLLFPVQFFSSIKLGLFLCLIDA
jgi:hypothetical protein